MHVLLLASGDLSRNVGLTLGLVAVGFGALAWVFFGAGGRELTSTGVLVVAVVLRVLLLPVPPTLSDDSLRYLWDGKVLAFGANPYELTPEADILEPLRDERWEAMPHRDVEAVYPPLALTLFSIAAALPSPAFAWKILLTAIELAGCLLLTRLGARLGLEPRRVALYAWNPLVTLEVAGMGHVDAVGVALVIATVSALESRRGWSPVAAAGAVLAKLVPLVAIPAWSAHARRPWSFAALCVTITAAGLAPVLWATGGLPPGWIRFGVSWEFNGPLYEPLWRTLEAIRVDDAIKLALDRAKIWTDAHEFWNRFYPYVYPRLLAKGLLGVLLAGLLWRVWRDREGDVVTATGRTFAALVLCSATVYPWYLLWMLPWAALACQPAWLALSGLILLSYVPQFTSLPLMPWVFLARLAAFRRAALAPSRMVYRLTLGYRGTGYAGWQRQANALAVQEVVEGAVAEVLGHPVRLAGAGRTDAGVHARGQVAHFESGRSFPQRGLVHATNRALPADIRVMSACRIGEGFHARKSATSKEYRYRLVRAEVLSPLDALFAVAVSPGLDLDAMRSATELLVGRHDFTAFALAGGSHRSPIRTIHAARWVERGTQFELRIEGDGFLRGMVRSIVGTLIEVGAGRRAPSDLGILLTGRSRSEAGPTAPAKGLELHRVTYPGRWKPLPD